MFGEFNVWYLHICFLEPHSLIGDSYTYIYCTRKNQFRFTKAANLWPGTRDPAGNELYLNTRTPSLNIKLISRSESDGRIADVNSESLFSHKSCFIVWMSNINLKIYFPLAPPVQSISTSVSGQSYRIESGRVTTQRESFPTLLGVLLAVNSYLFFRKSRCEARPSISLIEFLCRQSTSLYS